MIPRSRIVISSIASLPAFAALLWGAGGQPFHAGRAADYAHQTSEKVTVGAKPFDTDQLVVSAFGKKLNLLQYGILPVLVVVENGRTGTLDLANVQVTLVSSDGRHAEAVPPDDLYSLGTPHGSRSGASQVPLPLPLPKKKNPLSSPALSERSFAAKTLSPGESASGFFYFEAKSEPGDKVYLSGLQDQPSHKELLYFEFPMSGDLSGSVSGGN